MSSASGTDEEVEHEADGSESEIEPRKHQGRQGGSRQFKQLLPVQTDKYKETGTLWIQSVSQEILDSVDDTEKKRQEAINEVMYTERDFVRDLEYLKEQWVKPLLASDVIAANRREDFVRQVFWNVHDVWSTNHVLAERLTKRQKQQPVVSAIGDLFLERVPLWEPFVAYGAHQLFGKYEFEKEKGANPAFQRFVDVSFFAGINVMIVEE